MPWLALAMMCALFPGAVRPVRRRGAAAARLADLVRGGVGGAGVVEVDRSVRRLPLGRRWRSVKPRARFCRWSSSAALRCSRLAIVLVGFSADRDRAGDREVVADRQPRAGDDRPRTPTRRPRWCCRASASAWCCSPPSSSGRRCATPAPDRVASPSVTVAAVQGNVPRLGSGLQRATPSGAGQPRPRDAAAGRRRACGARPTTSIRDLARGLVGHRSTRQSRRRRSRSRRPPTAIGAPILVGTVLDAAAACKKPRIHQHGDRVESGHRTGRPPRQGNRAAVRRVPADAVASSSICPGTPTGPAISCPAKAAAWCTSPGCRSGWRPAGK